MKGILGSSISMNFCKVVFSLLVARHSIRLCKPSMHCPQMLGYTDSLISTQLAARFSLQVSLNFSLRFERRQNRRVFLIVFHIFISLMCE